MRKTLVIDGSIAVVTMALLLAASVWSIPLVSVTVDTSGTETYGDRESVAALLILVGSLSLIWRRRAPLSVLSINAASHCVYLILGFPPTRPLGTVIALYTVAETASTVIPTIAASVVAVSVIAASAVQMGWQQEDFDDRVLDSLLLVSVACMLGYGVQVGRGRTALLEAQAARLSREHIVAQEHAIRDEKSRIARELHDVVAHHVSVMTAQAVGAQRVFEIDPELTREALGSIEATGRGALIEMRRLLGVLRTEAAELEHLPQPALDQLPTLVAQTERAGLPVRLQIHGTRRELPVGVELNAFRIVQEALTNTLKHAGPSRASVELNYKTTSLEVQVSDDGRGFSAKATPGHGLIGMRQRTTLLGGELTVSRGPASGVTITASLPIE